MKTISTERLLIRRIEASDWEDIYEYLSDEEVIRFEPYDALTQEQVKSETENRAGNESFYAVCLKENQKMIGNFYLEQGEYDTCEMGYVFNRAYQGRGYATEGGRALLDHAFEERKAHRVVALCNPENKASWKLLERLNFRREGLLVQNIYFKKDADDQPIWLDTLEYAILQSEWVKAHDRD